MADWGWERWGSGSNHLPYEMEDAPLELYRTHEHQDRREVLQAGIDRWQQAQEFWLPQNMGQSQWKKDDDGRWLAWDDSARGYVQASMGAPMAPPRGGSTLRLPTVRDTRRVDQFQQAAVDIMQRSIIRMERKPQTPPGFAVSRNIPPPQLLPADLEALQTLEESAIGAAERHKSTAVRRCMNEIRALDQHYWGLAYGGSR